MKKLQAIVWLVIFIVVGLIHWLIQPLIVSIATMAALLGTGRFQQYGINVWEGKDNYASAQVGGDPDESLSSRLGKARARGSGWGYIANKVDLVAEELFNDPDHCHKSQERDEGRKQVTTY